LVGLLVFALAGFEGWVKVYERLSSIFELKDSAAGRVFIWRISFKIVRDYWFIGVGLDSIGLVFPRYLPINWLAVSERAFTDKAHSDILQVAVCQGIVGLIGYLWLFGSFFVLGFKKIARIVEEKKKLVSLSLFCAALAYFINLQFNFTMVEVTPIFWILAGILVGAEEDGIRIISFKQLRSLFKKRGVKLFLLALMGTLFLIGVYSGSKTLLADAYIRDAIEWSEVGVSDREIQQYLKAAKLDSSEGKYFYFLGLACFDRAKREKSENELERAIVSFKKGIELNQHDVLNYLGLERAYLFGGEAFNSAMLDKSIKTMKSGLKVTPYLPELWYDLGQAYEEKGLVEEAIDAYTMSLRIDTTNEFARDRIKLLKGETDE
ncbi:MAG: O-antigen ligase family protein, partial [Candidatus Subteraquimicrobiales bacterium]|nr:O-antigen ligase family protein [Candidatus Subteraquimicrobiales bacterium]